MPVTVLENMFINILAIYIATVIENMFINILAIYIATYYPYHILYISDPHVL